MFKFLKSKKGFTLVELMIVVVIMAILVAVAVPIFSAVTKNARIKTCQANRREIISQINNHAMAVPTATFNDKITISSDGDKATAVAVENSNGTGNAQFTTGLTGTFAGLFQEVPYCPGKGTYTVTAKTLTGGDAGGSVDVSVACAGSQDDDGTTNAHA